MALPDTFERVGVVVGSALLLALPASAALAVVAPEPWRLPSWLLWGGLLGPGAAVGALVAVDALPVSYRDVWLFSLAAWLATYLSWQVLGLSVPFRDPALAAVAMAAALAVAAAGVAARNRLAGSA